MALLSIIVPVYMSEKYIYKCVDSILEQSFKNFELILVDDGSIDNCPKILDDYEKKDERVRVIHQKNMGPISAKKTGLSIATGKYISFVDSDDWIEVRMFEIMVDRAEKYDSDVTICDSYIEYKTRTEISTQKISGGFYNKEKLENEVYPTLIYSKKEKRFNITPTLWNKIFKKSVVERYVKKANDNIRVGEDAVICYPTILNCNSIYYINIPLYHYYINPNAMTKTYDRYFFNKMNLLFDSLDGYFKGYRLDEQLNIYRTLLIVQGVRNEIESNEMSSLEKVYKIREIRNSYSYFDCSLENISTKFFEFDTRIWIIILRSKLLLLGILASKINFFRRKMKKM